MRLPRYLLFAFLLPVLICISCNKDKDSEPANQTPSQTLMSSTWKKSEYRENGVVKPFFASCEMDDVITFKSDGNWVLNGGADVCSNPGITTDFYNIESDNKTMHWGSWGVGELIFNSNKTSFTFKRTGANTFEYIFVKN